VRVLLPKWGSTTYNIFLKTAAMLREGASSVMGLNSTAAHSCIFFPEFTYDVTNGNSGHGRMMFLASMLIIGLQNLIKDVEKLKRSFQFWKGKFCSTQICHCLGTSNVGKGGL